MLDSLLLLAYALRLFDAFGLQPLLTLLGWSPATLPRWVAHLPVRTRR
jgi:hypothetical protein